MSYNPNFFNSYKGYNFTFQNNFAPEASFPLPPPPPPPVTPHIFTPELSDQDFVKKFENRIPETKTIIKPTSVSISVLREHILKLTASFNDIKKQEKILEDNIESLSEDDWKDAFSIIEANKSVITKILANLSGTYLDSSRRLIAKRSSKRLRLKRRRQELQHEKKKKIKEREERSRVIDENLQKIKDGIQKAKQAEEAKLQADVVLRDVIRKKSEAKKYISKLDALVKLRHARRNTALGRGEKVSETSAKVFETNIDKLKSMWIQKLSLYDVEESDLRATLKQAGDKEGHDTEKEVLKNLSVWRQVLFGGTENPQVDFHGDVQRFITVRSQWDRYLDSNGSPLPVGWVVPKIEN